MVISQLRSANELLIILVLGLNFKTKALKTNQHLVLIPCPETRCSPDSAQCNGQNWLFQRL